MERRQISDGIRRYKAENSASTIIFIESLLLAAFIGFRFHSFGYFILAMILLYFIVRFRIFAWIVTIGFSVGWGIIGAVLGFMFGVSTAYLSIILGIVFCIGFFMFSLRLHLLGYGMR